MLEICVEERIYFAYFSKFNQVFREVSSYRIQPKALHLSSYHLNASAFYLGRNLEIRCYAVKKSTIVEIMQMMSSSLVCGTAEDDWSSALSAP